MITTAKTKYGNIYVSDNDFIGKTLLSGEYFEEDLIDLIIPHIKENSNVLDIGANVGAFSTAFLKEVNCHVHAFEPQEFLVSLLSQTFLNNSHITLHQCAVGAKQGYANINGYGWDGEIYNPETFSNLGGVKLGEGGPKVTVIAIDDLDIKNISVIKIDVEGYEYQVILGAKKTIKEQKPFIVFESHHITTEERNYILEFLTDLGYMCEERLIDNLMNYICVPIIKRTDILNILFKKFNFESYLEIGVHDPTKNFEKINAIVKQGVEPLPVLDNGAVQYCTSDEFFASNDKKFDVIFIDGLHTAEQAYKDVKNAMLCLNDKGFIVMHDCNPTQFIWTVPFEKYQGGAWMGNVYKAFIRLKNEHKDWSCFVVNEDCGCGILTERPILKNKRLTYGIGSSSITWEKFDEFRNELLQLITYDDYKELL